MSAMRATTRVLPACAVGVDLPHDASNKAAPSKAIAPALFARSVIAQPVAIAVARARRPRARPERARPAPGSGGWDRVYRPAPARGTRQYGVWRHRCADSPETARHA